MTCKEQKGNCREWTRMVCIEQMMDDWTSRPSSDDDVDDDGDIDDESEKELMGMI